MFRVGDPEHAHDVVEPYEPGHAVTRPEHLGAEVQDVGDLSSARRRDHDVELAAEREALRAGIAGEHQPSPNWTS